MKQQFYWDRLNNMSSSLIYRHLLLRNEKKDQPSWDWWHNIKFWEFIKKKRIMKDQDTMQHESCNMQHQWKCCLNQILCNMNPFPCVHLDVLFEWSMFLIELRYRKTKFLCSFHLWFVSMFWSEFIIRFECCCVVCTCGVGTW